MIELEKATENCDPTSSPCLPVSLSPCLLGTLREIVRRYGTPTYAYDLGRIRAQVAKLRTYLPETVQVLYSLKANASLGLCGFLAGLGLGADVASAGELLTAVEAGFPPERIFLTGPDKSPAVLAELRSLPEVVLSLDSVSELRLFAGRDQPRRAILRLRPDFCSYASCSAGPDSRFGLTFDDLPRCREYLDASPLTLPSPPGGEGTLLSPSPPGGGEGRVRGGVQVVGFPIFSGSQVLAVEGILHHLRGGLDLALRAAEVLRITPEIIDIGGGFGVPYGPEDCELDLAPIGEELRSLAARAAPARLVIELGRYLIAQAGWYLTTVIAHQKHGGHEAVVVDGGSHQRADLCGLGLRHKAFAPAVLTERTGPLRPTAVLGCLSLPGDVLTEAGLLPPLAAGDLLAYPNAGAYGLSASALHFHAHPAPAEAAFDGTRLELLRVRQSAQDLLKGQARL